MIFSTWQAGVISRVIEASAELDRGVWHSGSSEDTFPPFRADRKMIHQCSEKLK